MNETGWITWGVFVLPPFKIVKRRITERGG
jgi:hypothetical protein